MKATVLLKHLDSPMRFLMLTINDIIGYVIPVILGVVFDSFFIIPICGVILVHRTKRFLRRFPNRFIVRYSYWAIPTIRFNKLMGTDFVPSSKRFWVK